MTASLAAVFDTADDLTSSWRDGALCAQIGSDEFFPEKGGSTRAAKKVCASCEVRAQCLQFALDNEERFGIWGGLSERERRRLRAPSPVPVLRGRRPVEINHGTEAGYRAHLRRGGSACASCADAALQAQRRRRETAAPAPVVPEVEVPRERPGLTRPWRPAELAEAVALLNDYGMGPAEIAAELHASPARVRAALRARRGAA